VVIPCRDQPGGAGATLREWSKVLFAPDIVHDQENAPVSQSLA
jgi:hypothetical protein